MTEIAVSLGNLTIYWSGIVITFGIMAWFFLSYALYAGNGGRGSAMWVLFPFATVFSVLLSRILHWYCHAEQYTGLIGAVTDYSSGSFVLPGMLIGVWLAALLVKALGYTDSTRRLLDALAPGAALGIAFIRLSALFNNSCRAKIVITSPALQRLPLGAPFITAAGTEYRFASFFVEFILMMLLCWRLLRFYHNGRNRRIKGGYSRDGHIAMMFIVFYSVIEFVLDSTRYDKSFFPFCGFVSFVQIFIAFAIAGVLVYYSVISVRTGGLRWYHWTIWGIFFVALAVTGFLEYWVQRHGDLYLSCYSGMTVSMLVMAIAVYKMYDTCLKRRRT